jgi:hypothetical protein
MWARRPCSSQSLVGWVGSFYNQTPRPPTPRKDLGECSLKLVHAKLLAVIILFSFQFAAGTLRRAGWNSRAKRWPKELQNNSTTHKVPVNGIILQGLAWKQVLENHRLFINVVNSKRFSSKIFSCAGGFKIVNKDFASKNNKHLWIALQFTQPKRKVPVHSNLNSSSVCFSWRQTAQQELQHTMEHQVPAQVP